jgi:hypothetical protein
VQHLSDAELNAVYAGSLFTLFPSFVEGWGLPVGESLSHGRPCIASGASSIPEAGGPFVDYIDPHDLESGVAALRRMILDEGYRAARTALIEQQFVPRGWDDVGRDFVAAVQGLVERSPSGVPRRRSISLPDGRMIALSDPPARTTSPEDYARNPIALLFGSFYPARPAAGMWMRGRSGRIRLAEGLRRGERIVVTLRLIVAPWGTDGRLHVASSLPEDAVSLPIRDLDPSGLVTLETAADEEGVLRIDLAWDGAIAGPPDDPRRYAIGLSAIGYACKNGEFVSP